MRILTNRGLREAQLFAYTWACVCHFMSEATDTPLVKSAAQEIETFAIGYLAGLRRMKPKQLLKFYRATQRQIATVRTEVPKQEAATR